MDIKKKKEEPAFQSDEQPDKTGERIRPSGSFQRLNARIKNTKVYQIFFVRAMKSRFSKGLYFLFFLCTVFGHAFFVNLLTPPLKFHELSVMQGYYEGYNRSRKGGDKIIIRDEKGGIEKFVISSDHEYEREQKLNNLKGKLIKIYYSIHIHVFLYPFKNAEAIAYENTFIHEYKLERYNRWVIMHNAFMILFPICVVLGFFLLYCIYRRHRRK